jgi:hypothetical protein
MEETINDRIEQLVDERFNGNKAAFAKAIAYPPTAMSSYLGKQRRSKPSIDMVAKIIQVLNVDANWLILGETSDSASTKIEAHDNGQAAGRDINNNGVCSMELARLKEIISHLEQRVADKDVTIADKDERISDLKERIEELKSR